MVYSTKLSRYSYSYSDGVIHSAWLSMPESNTSLVIVLERASERILVGKVRRT